MTYVVKDEAPCIDCGTLTTKRQPKSRAALCITCGVNRACRNIRFEADRAEKRIRRDRRAMERQMKNR